MTVENGRLGQELARGTLPNVLRALRAPGRIGAALARRAVHGQLARLSRDLLVVHEHTREWRHGCLEPELVCHVEVHDPVFYTQLLLGGDLGAADSYLEGLWSCDDLPALFRILLRNEGALAGLERGLARAGRALVRRMHLSRSNHRAGSRRNIAQHYDLGNAFFERFLDPTLTYSNAIFEHPQATLEQASIAKLERLCRKLDLRPHDHLLEIGTGWGSLALHAAAHHGCRVTTTTISAAQYERAVARVAAAGLEERVTVWRRDYRDLEGVYEKIISIEMLEAVGQDYLGEFFGVCQRHLRPDGRVALQVITTPDRRWETYRRSVDFIQSHVFPGSCCPSLGALVAAMAARSSLRLVHLEDLSPHYATTLRAWRTRFADARDEIVALGATPAFLRLWDYYLAYCEAGFTERHVASLQLVLAGPGFRDEDHLIPRVGATTIEADSRATAPAADGRVTAMAPC